MNVLYAQMQQCQQDDDRFLLIPRNVVDNGQFVDVLQSEHLLQLERDDRQRVAVVALSGIEHTRNASDVSQIQLVVFVFGASGCQNDTILRQGTCKVCVIIAALHASVTARHHHKLTDGSALDRLDHLVGQLQHLVVCKAAHDASGFNLCRRRTVFC